MPNKSGPNENRERPSQAHADRKGTKGERFAGLTVALVTPFRDGAVDEAALRKLVDFHVEAGTDCLSPVGTTGESPTLSHDEHERVIAVVCQHAAGRIKVVAGTGSNSTAEAVRLTRFAKQAGADGALWSPPITTSRRRKAFTSTSRQSPRPSTCQSCFTTFPAAQRKILSRRRLSRLAEIPSIVAIKESTGSMDQASQILALTDLTVLSGDDSLTLPLLSIGGRGVVSVVGNIIPRDVKALIAAFNSGDLAGAIKWHYKLFPLCRDMLGLATNPIPIKAAMRLLRRDTGELRLPMTPLNETDRAALNKTLVGYGLL